MRAGASQPRGFRKQALFANPKPRGAAGFRKPAERQQPGMSAIVQRLAFVHDFGFRPVSAPVRQAKPGFGLLDEAQAGGQ
jgi:hypothetical protein